MLHDRRSASLRWIVRFITVALAGCLSSASPVAQATAIEEARFIQLGGVEQWITIRGANRESPVLLILHGGPGEAQSPLVSTWEPLERDFVVLQWDQRGGGRTLARAGAAGQATSLEQLTLDGIELARYLRGYLRTDSVVLVGHSWGSFLGVHIVKRQPQLFKAFVGTGQVTTWRSMVEAQYAYALSRARSEPNAAAVAELESQGVPASDNFDQYLVMRRWLNRYLATSDLQWISKQDALVQSALGATDLMAYRQGFRTMTGLSSTVFAMDVFSLGFDFKTPFFLIQGSDDHIASTELSSSYFDKINAPVKRMTLIEGAGHFAPMTHMQQFAAALRDDFSRLPH